MKILLINPPVYTPTTFPYSLAAMKGELTAAIDEEITVLDLNASFHYDQFPDFYQRLESIKTKESSENYFTLLEEFYNTTKQTYAQISKAAIQNQEPIGTQEAINQILKHHPNIVAISVTYNSQIFMTKVLINWLQEANKNIKIIIGGPADYSKIIANNPKITNLASAQKLIEYLIANGAKIKETKSISIPDSKKFKEFLALKSPILDFSDFNKKHYFTKEIVYPIRTSTSCPYKRCTFCTHHENKNYQQFDLENLKQTIKKNNIQKICFIDDDLTAKRLIEIAQILKPLNTKWWCQLRPIKNIQGALKIAQEAGLTSVAWGLESGNQRILNLIDKGTNLTDIKTTLNLATELNIKNQLYVLFGFPTEKKKEFEDTINFLKNNKNSIDLISPSIFGLQYGSKTLESPELFDITNIHLEQRTLLSPKITYKTKSGLTKAQTKQLKKKHNKTLNSLNMVPKIISVFKEQILNFNHQ